jgi:hypothetical protein
MVLPIIYRGESRNPSFAIKDADGNAVLHANILDAVVVLKVGGVAVAKYKKVSAVGYTALISEPDPGKYSLPIESSETKKWPTGVLTMWVKVMTTNASLEGDYVNISPKEVARVEGPPGEVQ